MSFSNYQTHNFSHSHAHTHTTLRTCSPLGGAAGSRHRDTTEERQWCRKRRCPLQLAAVLSGGQCLRVWIQGWGVPSPLSLRSVVGLQSAVLLFQPLDLLHQRLVHRVSLNQTVDLILKRQIHLQWCLLGGWDLTTNIEQRFSPAGCRTAGPSPPAGWRCPCDRCPFRGDTIMVMATHISQWCSSDYRGGHEPKVLQSFMNHVLDEVDLQRGERSGSSLSNHLRDVLGERRGHGCRQRWTWRCRRGCQRRKSPACGCAVHRFTCCCPSLDRRVVAQLRLNPVRSPQFWSEEGRGWLAKTGLLGWSWRGTNFPLQTGAAGSTGLEMKTCTCYPSALRAVVPRGLRLYLGDVTWLVCHSRHWLLLFDGRGLVGRQRAEASPRGGYQRRP